MKPISILTSIIGSICVCISMCCSAADELQPKLLTDPHYRRFVSTLPFSLYDWTSNHEIVIDIQSDVYLLDVDTGKQKIMDETMPRSTLIRIQKFGQSHHRNGQTWNVSVHKAKIPQDLKTALPATAIIMDSVDAPGRDRHAWFVIFTDASIMARWVHSVWPSSNDRSSAMMAVWITQKHGGPPRMLGFKPLDDSKGEMPIRSLNWTPDGKQISYYDQQALYTIPVN